MQSLESKKRKRNAISDDQNLYSYVVFINNKKKESKEEFWSQSSISILSNPYLSTQCRWLNFFGHIFLALTEVIISIFLKKINLWLTLLALLKDALKYVIIN